MEEVDLESLTNLKLQLIVLLISDVYIYFSDSSIEEIFENKLNYLNEFNS